MMCPVCAKGMYDNRNSEKNKANPKLPDYRCKDKNCKWEMDKKTKQFKPSEYVTAVWETKRTPQEEQIYHSADKLPEVKVFQGTLKEEATVQVKPTPPTDDMDIWLLYFQRLEQVLDLFKSKECNAETPLSSAILGLRGLMGI